jgi:hypothetical protein
MAIGRGDLAAGGRRGDQAEVCEFGVGCEAVKQRPELSTHLCCPTSALSFSGRDHRLAQKIGHLGIGIGERMGLARVVLVEGAAREATGGGVGHGRRHIPALHDGLDHASGDPAALILLDELSWQSVTPGGQSLETIRRSPHRTRPVRRPGELAKKAPRRSERRFRRLGGRPIRRRRDADSGQVGRQAPRLTSRCPASRGEGLIIHHAIAPPIFFLVEA